MKKFFTSKKCLLMLAIAGLMSVACGLKISSIVISDNQPVQGDDITVTTTFMDPNSMDPDNAYKGGEYYNCYAIRIPDDWEATKLVVTDIATDNADESVDVEMVSCPAYAVLAEYCFPRDGYKWVGFQSTEQVKVSVNVKAEVFLTVGQTIGDYSLDILVGGWQKNPSEELLTESGEIDFEHVFGRNYNETGVSTDLGKTYYKTSEYLFISGTIGSTEFNESMDRLKSKTITINDTELPIGPDVANMLSDADLEQMNNLDVTVAKKVTTGIEETEAAAEVAVVAGDGCVEVAAAAGVAVVYNAAGVLTDSKAVSGSASLRAHKGVNLVKVATASGVVVKKVVVK